MHGNGHVIIRSDRPQNHNEKVQVQCTRCGEVFYRELRFAHLNHTCPSHTTTPPRSATESGNIKWCCGCERYTPHEFFTRDETRFDGLSRFCVRCDKNNVLENKAGNLIEKHSDKSLQISDIIQQYYYQNGLCYRTNIPLTFDDGDRSIELISQSSGCIILVCKALVGDSGPIIDFLLEVMRSSQQNIRLETKINKEGGRLPFRKRTSDAGYDVHSNEDLIIDPNSSASVDTGIIVSPPEGAYYTIEGRSSVFAAGVTPYRGIIDGTYQGPLKVILMNNSDKPYKVCHDDRIAQLVLHPIVSGDFILIDSFTPVENGRMSSGWGSSGR